jgi:hypothetical protein
LSKYGLQSDGTATAKAVRDKGVKWLAATQTDGDPQSVAMRLVIWKRLDRPAEEWQPLVRRIKERQNADGGWSQTKDMASDAWATGQALYALQWPLGDSNPDALRHKILSLACLPIPPSGLLNSRIAILLCPKISCDTH